MTNTNIEKFIINGSFESFMNLSLCKMKNILLFLAKIDKHSKLPPDLEKMSKLDKLKELERVYYSDLPYTLERSLRWK